VKKIAYLPGESGLHALHPFTKFAILLGMSIFIFFIESPTFMLFLLILLCIVFMRVCRSPFHYLGMRTTFFTAVMIAIIQCVFLREGNGILRFLGLTITDVGFKQGILISSRFLLIILSSFLFIFTTSPSDFAFALMQMGVPYRYAFMIITSLHLVPLLSIEGERIFIAQEMRGMKYDLRKPKLTFLNISAFMSAILFSLVSRVNKLAISMEGRSFGRYAKRTFQKPIIFTYRDGLILGAFGLFILLFCFLKKGRFL